MSTQGHGSVVGRRLSVMMFLQYAIWGAWLPLLYPYLLGHRGFSLDQVGMILAAGAVGAIFGPFIAGQVADRYFATQKFLAVSHLLGALLVWLLASTEDFGVFLGLSLLYGLVYAPTLALTNSLCFHHLTDRDKQFGPIRLWGTIGWICVGFSLTFWLSTTDPSKLPSMLAWTSGFVEWIGRTVASLTGHPANPHLSDSLRFGGWISIFMGVF